MSDPYSEAAGFGGTATASRAVSSDPYSAAAGFPFRAPKASADPSAAALTIAPSQRMPDSSAANPANVAEIQQALASNRLTASERAGLQDILRAKMQTASASAAPVNGGLGAVNPHRNVPQDVAPAIAHVPGTNDQVPGAVPTGGAGPVPTWYDKAKAVGQGVASVADTVLGAPAQIASSAIYAGGRALGQSPQQAQTTATNATEWAANPVGKAFGVENTPGYQGEASRQLMAFVGENIGKGAAWISKATGVPEADVQNMIGTLSVAAPGAVSTVAKGAFNARFPGAAQAIQDQFAARQAGPLPIERRVEPTLAKPRYGVVNGKIQRIDEGAPQPAPAPVPVAAGDVPAASSVKAAPQPGASIAPITLDFSSPKAFEDAPATSAKIPLPQQGERAQVLQSVGIENARKSSLANDGLAAASEAQMAKLDTPAGRAMKAQLDSEKAALNDYSAKLVRDTGGTALSDQAADYTRGTNINAALQGLKNWYDTKISGLYKVADERAQGVPSELDTFRTVLGDDSQMTNSDRVYLRGAVQAYAKKLGIIGEDGSVFSNAQQAETMRKYLNENWTPANSRFVGALKDAIDEDVTKAAGEDVYSAARQMRAERGRTLDNPNGIAKLMEESGPDGINRAVDLEKIPTKVTSMGVDQLRHVVETLRNAPDEVQPAAQSALAEIKSKFADQVRNIGGSQAGQFNAKGVGEYLRANAARMSAVFTPEEMANFRNLHRAGQILAKDQSYPGAAVQEHNLVRSGAMAAVRSGATATGAALGGPMGAAAGGYIGDKAAQAIGDRGSLKAVQSRITRLSEFPK